MQPKPKHDKAEHDKTEHDKTEHSTTPSPTEVVDGTVFDYETLFMQHAASNPDGRDDGSEDDDAVATDEAAVMAELVQEASAANMTLQVLLAVKRPREEPEHTEPAESEAELVKKHIGGEEGLRQFCPILTKCPVLSRFVPCPGLRGATFPKRTPSLLHPLIFGRGRPSFTPSFTFLPFLHPFVVGRMWGGG